MGFAVDDILIILELVAINKQIGHICNFTLRVRTKKHGDGPTHLLCLLALSPQGWKK